METIPGCWPLQPQQDCPCCTGGQGTAPYEQNTQQSPCLGDSTAAQPGHSKKNRHEVVAISACVRCPQWGQVNVLCNCGLCIGLSGQGGTPSDKREGGHHRQGRRRGHDTGREIEPAATAATGGRPLVCRGPDRGVLAVQSRSARILSRFGGLHIGRAVVSLRAAAARGRCTGPDAGATDPAGPARRWRRRRAPCPRHCPGGDHATNVKNACVADRMPTDARRAFDVIAQWTHARPARAFCTPMPGIVRVFRLSEGDTPCSHL